MDKPRCVDMGHTLFVDSCRQHMGMVMSAPGSSEITREHEEEGGYRCMWCGSNVNDWADQICIPRIGNKVIPEPDSSESGLDWTREKFNCPECGEGVVVDDKGWCTTCGNNRIRQRTSQAGGSAPRVDTKYDDGTHGGKYPYLDSMSTSPDESDQAVSGEPEARESKIVLGDLSKQLESIANCANGANGASAMSMLRAVARDLWSLARQVAALAPTDPVESELVAWQCRVRGIPDYPWVPISAPLELLADWVTILTKDYERNDIFAVPENKANSNPIKPNFRKTKMNLNFYPTKDYKNEPLRRR
ncbi:hypothetical protein LCGC14_2648020 [marine sediment metagenome]|uniref:Uncharacterized protein n=1 Tax=marine sediment metagenome TaxID=412755 RepID=A0A0F9CMR1_9ZZZZ